MKTIIAFLPQTRNPRRKTAAGEGGLEREVLAFVSKLAQAPEHDAAGFERGAFRRERGNSRGNDIRVDELGDAEPLADQQRRRAGLARAIRSGDDENVRQEARSRARGIRL